jgi:hypothetical protein
MSSVSTLQFYRRLYGPKPGLRIIIACCHQENSDRERAVRRVGYSVGTRRPLDPLTALQVVQEAINMVSSLSCDPVIV